MARDRAALILAIVGLLIAPLGWVVAQLLDAIPSSSGYEELRFASLAASVYAVPLFVSGLINSGIVISRYRNGTASYAPRGYPLWQSIVIALGLAWIACIVIGDWALTFGLIVGVMLALASIVTCVFAARREALSAQRRTQLRASRTPAEARRARVTAIAVPLGVAVVLAGAVAIVQNVEVVHSSCQITGSGSSSTNGSPRVFEVSSPGCGRFYLSAEAAKKFSVDELLYSGQTFDITSRGYGFGLPPVAIAIDFALSD